MKKLLLTIGLVTIASVGWGQNEVILIEEDFNESYISGTSLYNPVFNNYYLHVSNYCTGEFYLEEINPIDSSQYLKFTSNSNGLSPWIQSNDCGVDLDIIPSLDFTPFDSIKISFQCQSPGTSWECKVLNGGDWISIISNNSPSTSEGNDWYSYEYILPEEYIMNSDAGVKIITYDNAPFGTSLFCLDNFKVLGYQNLPCDTVYITLQDTVYLTVPDTVYLEQPPIIIYETDIPQECMLDGNGDGIIGMSDLLNLLQYFGNPSPCMIFNFNSPSPTTKSTLSDIDYYKADPNKTVLKIININGQEVLPNTPGLLLYIYNDGTVEKQMNFIN